MTGGEFDAFFRPEWWSFLITVLTKGIAAEHSTENYGPVARKNHRHGTRCQARHDHFVAFAKEEMLSVDGVRYLDASGKDVFIFGDRVATSFNLLDDNHRVRLNKTHQSVNLNCQRLIALSDLPEELTLVVAGYTVDGLKNPKELWLICPDGRHSRWERRMSAPPMDDMLDTIYPSAPKPPNMPYRFRDDVDEVAHDEERQYGTDGSVEESS